MKNIKPIILTDTDTGAQYTLEFNRESIRFAESRGFDIQDIEKHPMTRVPELFFYAFRMHNKSVSREKTDKILFDDLGGVSDAMLERLGQLYAAPLETLIAGENEPKNSKMTVEM